MNIPLTLEEIQKYLTDLGLAPQLQKETDQLIVIYKISGAEFPVFFRIYPGGELLQLIAFIPCQLKPAAAPELARLLHLINKEMDLPGFGMDEQARIIYYRLMLPAVNKQIQSEILETATTSIKTICETFGAVISNVAAGASTYEQILRQLNQAQRQGG